MSSLAHYFSNSGHTNMNLKKTSVLMDSQYSFNTYGIIEIYVNSKPAINP